MATTKGRSSNIELLKIIAIYLIIVSHFIQTYAQFQSLGYATDNVQLLSINVLRYLSHLGNNLFFVCSAWFLIDSEKNNKKKLFSLLLNVWVVSVLIMFFVLVLGGKHLHGSEILKCLLPTTFSNNWYITCYVLFCLFYPAVRQILVKLPERKLLSFLIISFFLSYVITPLFKEWEGGYFYVTQLVAWFMIYSLLFYFKRYAPNVLDSRKINLAVFLVSLIGFAAIPMTINILAKHIAFFEGRLLFFNDIYNIFPVTLAISSLNLFRRLRLQSKMVNRISACTLYIYIIHENILLRQYYRPLLFEHIESVYGMQHALWWILLMALLTLFACTILAIIYQKTLQIIVSKAVDYSYPRLRNRWNYSLDVIHNLLGTIK